MKYYVNQKLLYVFLVQSGDPHRDLCDKVLIIFRDLRRKKGLSVYALSQRSGVSQQMIAYLEKGQRTPSLQMALRLAEALELKLERVLREARSK